MAKTTPTTPDSGGGRRLPSRPRVNNPATATARTSGSHPVTTRSAPSILAFFRESRSELRKVTWPTRQETTNLTTAVIGMTLGVAIFLGLIDAGLDKLVSLLLGGG